MQVWNRNTARFIPGIEIVQTGLAAALLRKPANKVDESQAHYIKIPRSGLPTRTRLLHRTLKRRFLSFLLYFSNFVKNVT
jgi:hypothetical protein